nr:hypothetical protein [Tanacetum cinerariifolium]
GDDVVITGVHDNGIYFTYENVEPNKCKLLQQWDLFTSAEEPFFTSSGKVFWQWELITGSRNALNEPASPLGDDSQVQTSSAVGSLYLSRGNLSSLAVGKSYGSGNSSLAVGMP